MESLRERLLSGRKLFGTHVQLSDHRICEMLGFIGFDYLWIDTEHTSTDYKELETHLIAARAGGVPAIVRVPDNQSAMIKRVVDMGVDGIIVPMVNTMEEAQRVIDSCLYPPDGSRGCGPFRAVRYGMDSLDEYFMHTNREMCRFLQIESRIAVDNLAQMAKLPFVDGFIIGPSDLSASIGMFSQLYHQEINALIEKAINEAHKAGKPIGLSYGISNEKLLTHFMQIDLDFISIGSDAGFITGGASDLLRHMKALGKLNDDME